MIFFPLLKLLFMPKGLAERYLRQGSGSITDLALQLGYAELAVFSRHFKRWSGMTPQVYRVRART